MFDNVYEIPNDFDRRDFHAVISVTLGELVDGGWLDWEDESWQWDYYDDEQRQRLQRMIEARYWSREISEIPPALWRIHFLERLNESMRIASVLYKIREKIDENPILSEDVYHKSRDIYSDFPATLLNGSSADYASTGTDREYETIRDLSGYDAMRMIKDDFIDPDLFILDRLEIMFSKLVSVNINGF